MSGSMVMYVTAYYCLNRTIQPRARLLWALKLTHARDAIRHDWEW